MTEHTGHCLCGAVTVRVTGLSKEISACHCELCTRWSGGVQMGIEAPAGQLTVDGPVKSHRSSRLAERAWCDVCGSSVWFRYVEGRDAGYVELCPGLFDNAAGARLTRVVYADRAPDGFSLAGDFERVSQAQYEAGNPHLNEEV
ncbi:GFA family protein [Roseobacteraceae bacterium NS-SX3]